MLPLPRARVTLVLVAALAGIAAASVPRAGADDRADVKSPAAKAARAERDAALARAEADWQRRAADAQRTYVEKLDAAVKSLTRRGELDEAERALALRKRAEAESPLSAAEGADIPAADVVAAKAAHDAALAKAEADHEKKVHEAARVFVKKVDRAMRDATKKGDLEEAQRLLAIRKAAEAWIPPATDEDAPPAAERDGDWAILLRGRDPSLWNTDARRENGDLALAASRAPVRSRYLRLRRLDTGDLVVIPIVRERLTSAPTGGKHGWEGTKTLTAGGVHLGIDNAGWVCEVRHGGRILVSPSRNTMGWGFGHKIHVNDATYCTWAGETIGDTAFEIAVTSRALTPAEKEKLLE